MLQDGTLFEGESFGYEGVTTGEVCFNTGMTGYQEIFTDPSYFGQVLIMNAVHIGNYGARDEDVESDSIKISGLICKTLSDRFSRTMATESLEDYLIRNKIIAIQKVDTRALVSHIREKGAMNCLISSTESDIAELKKILDNTPSMEGLELSSRVTTQDEYEQGKENAVWKIAVLDLGIKKNILRCMTERGARVRVFPARTGFAEMEAWEPHAFFISNGPGDPGVMDYAIDTTRKMIQSGLPVFGICLGHQIIAQACGIPTYKMHHGHRGANHPVKNLLNGLCEISTQNHGFAVDAAALEGNPEIEVTHLNLNDGTIEGIRLKNKPVFSVQYHPEAMPGPHDSRYLFDEFMNRITGSPDLVNP